MDKIIAAQKLLPTVNLDYELRAKFWFGSQLDKYAVIL
jgi:hypothetical protein